MLRKLILLGTCIVFVGFSAAAFADSVNEAFLKAKASVISISKMSTMNQKLTSVTELRNNLDQSFKSLPKKYVRLNPGKTMQLFSLFDYVQTIESTIKEKGIEQCPTLKEKIQFSSDPTVEELPKDPTGTLKIAFDLIDAVCGS